MATDNLDRAEILLPNKCQVREGSHDSRIQSMRKTEKKVAVIYYISRNGQLEHPHFMTVPLSSPQGLYLTDVKNTLNLLRGPGMANMYSWSSKRSYKTGFVWQDLSDDDFIHPCHDQDYILKGTILLETSSFRSFDTSSSSPLSTFTEDGTSAISGRRSYSSRSTIYDHSVHKIYKARTSEEFVKEGANMSTQTDDSISMKEDSSAEMSDPSFSSSSKPEESKDKTIEIYGSEGDDAYQYTGNVRQSRRMKIALLLLNIVKCGSRKSEP